MTTLQIRKEMTHNQQQQTLQQWKVAKFVKDGYHCECVTCAEVVSKFHAQGNKLHQLLSGYQQRSLDETMAKRKVASVSFTIEPNTFSSTEKHTGFDFETRCEMSCFAKCDQCHNASDCEYSGKTNEKCSITDAVLLYLCMVMLFARDNLRCASCDGCKTQEELSHSMWTCYLLTFHVFDVFSIP